MANSLRSRVARLEAADGEGGERFDVAGHLLTHAEVTGILVAVDGRSRGLPAEQGRPHLEHLPLSIPNRPPART